MKTIAKQTLPVVCNGRDEMNLAEWPIASLARHIAAGTKTLEYQDTFMESGKPLIRRLTVTASDKWGLPTATDDEVMVGLIQLTELTKEILDDADRKVHFNRYQLLDIIGWTKGGHSYERLQESLQRWVGVTLHYENAWRNNVTRKWVSETFHILDNVSMDTLTIDVEPQAAKKGSKRNQPKEQEKKEISLWFFTWNEVVFQSFKDKHTKSLNLVHYRQLTLPTSKRMYRFLDKRLNLKNHLEMDLRVFACEHIGLSRDYSNSQLQRKLAPAIAELERLKILQPHDNRFRQVRRGQWRVCFAFIKAPEKVAGEVPEEREQTEKPKKLKSSSAKSEKLATPNQQPPSVLSEPLTQALIARGVTKVMAEELVASFPGERIERCLKVFDWLKENNDPKLSKNPPGYLVQSIRKDYQAPEGFESSEQQKKKQESAQARRQQQKQEKEATRQKEQQERALQRAQQEHIDRYLANLSTVELQRLEEQAVSNGDAEKRKAAQERNAMGNVARRLLVNREVLRIHPLPAQMPVPAQEESRERETTDKVAAI